SERLRGVEHGRSALKMTPSCEPFSRLRDLPPLATGCNHGAPERLHPALSRLATRRSLYAGNVPGASEEARRVKIMNANWIAGADGEDGDFELMIVTSDDRHHVVAPSPAAMAALVALAQADTVFVWDPADRRL